MRLNVFDVSRLFALGLLLVGCSPPTQPASREKESGQSGIKGEFPLILYGVPNREEDLRRAKDLGFNHVYRSGSGFAGDPDDSERMADIQSYLDGAAKEGLKVAFCLDGHRRIFKGEAGIEQMRRIVKRFKDHPAVGFWYFYDEPNLPSPKTKKAMLAARYQEENGGATTEVVKEVVSPPEVLLPAYEMVKKEAPGIPVIIMMAVSSDDAWWADAWKKFYSTYDIVSFDTYPVFEKPFPTASIERVTSWMDRYTKGTDKPVMPCLQIFNWNTLSARVERAKATGNTQYVNWRYPNLEELRYWNFSSLMQGAPGAIYYTYGGPDLQRRPPEAWLEGVLKNATHEFKRFTALVRNAPSRKLLLAGQGPLFSASWQTEEGVFLVIANGSAAKQYFAEGEGLSLLNRGTVKAWDFTRPTGLDVTTGKISGINLEPWEVQVWQIK